MDELKVQNNKSASRRSVNIIGTVLLVIGYCATLVFPVLFFVQKKTAFLYSEYQYSLTGNIELRFWQDLRGDLVLWLGPSIMISFFAGIVGIFVLKGWKKIFGILLMFISIGIFLASIPAT